MFETWKKPKPKEYWSPIREYEYCIIRGSHHYVMETVKKMVSESMNAYQQYDYSLENREKLQGIWELVGGVSVDGEIYAQAIQRWNISYEKNTITEPRP